MESSTTLPSWCPDHFVCQGTMGHSYSLPSTSGGGLIVFVGVGFNPNTFICSNGDEARTLCLTMQLWLDRYIALAGFELMEICPPVPPETGIQVKVMHFHTSLRTSFYFNIYLLCIQYFFCVYACRPEEGIL